MVGGNVKIMARGERKAGGAMERFRRLGAPSWFVDSEHLMARFRAKLRPGMKPEKIDWLFGLTRSEARAAADLAAVGVGRHPSKVSS